MVAVIGRRQIATIVPLIAKLLEISSPLKVDISTAMVSTKNAPKPFL